VHTVLLSAAVGAAAGPWIQTSVHRYASRPALVRCVCAAAVTLGVLAWRFDDLWTLLAYGWAGLVGVALAFVDAAVHRLPDRLTWALAAGVLAVLSAAALAGHRYPELGRAVVAASATAVFYAVLVSRGGMGPGDAKLALGTGAVLGWAGWWPAFLGVLAAFLLAAGHAAVLLARGRIRRTDHLPHGPAMLAAAFIVLIATG
jgi:leader peptidase (prepilin peptidase)/N-methyltransferase